MSPSPLSLHIAIVEPHGTGGLAHYAYQIATALAEAGATVTLLTSSDYELADLPHSFRLERRLRLWPHHDSAAAARHTGGSGRRLRYRLRRGGRRLLRGVRFIRAWMAVVALVSRERPDIVQLGKINYPFQAPFLVALRRRGLVLADVCHEFELRERGGWPARVFLALARAVYGRFDVIFVHGEATRRRFLELFPGAAPYTHVIRHGNQDLFLAVANPGGKSDPGTRLGIRREEPVVLFFGTLAPSKGLEDLVRAHAIVRRTHPAQLVISGFPSKFFDLRRLKRVIAEVDVVDSVVLDLRYVPLHEVAAVHELASVVVYPYRNATDSGALRIAYTFGKPVIATSVGSLAEAVDHGRSGLVVKPELPEALADAIVDILSEPERAARMGEYGRHLAETRFSWAGIAEEILGVYADLRSARRPAARDRSENGVRQVGADEPQQRNVGDE